MTIAISLIVLFGGSEERLIILPCDKLPSVFSRKYVQAKLYASSLPPEQELSRGWFMGDSNAKQ